MPKRFKNPPLVELIAELRWGTAGIVAGPQGAPQLVMATGSQYEEFFMRFGSKIAALGYERIERIIPPGFPAPPFQATYRFRKKEPEQGTTLYQVGGGVFSANITPPTSPGNSSGRSWSTAWNAFLKHATPQSRTRHLRPRFCATSTHSAASSPKGVRSHRSFKTLLVSE